MRRPTLVAPVASDRTCDPVAATEAEAATEAATEAPRARDRKIAEACDRACDRQRPKKRGQQLLRPGVFSHLVETKRCLPEWILLLLLLLGLELLIFCWHAWQIVHGTIASLE